MRIIEIIRMVWKRLKRFPCYIQSDMMDSRPAALASMASYYGKRYSLSELRELCSPPENGVSMPGIEDAARKIGFETQSIKTTIARLCRKNPIPCILVWDNARFVVLYDIRKSLLTGQRYFYISDPSCGRMKVNENEFCLYWCNEDGEGIALLMTPSV